MGADWKYNFNICRFKRAKWFLCFDTTLDVEQKDLCAAEALKINFQPQKGDKHSVSGS